MFRRGFIGLLICAALSGQSRDDVLQLVEPLAAALSAGDASSFLRHIPADSPGYDDLRRNVEALLAVAEVTSSVLLVKSDGGVAELDWRMQIRSKATGSLMERRAGVVTLKVEGKQIRSITPVLFFRSPRIGLKPSAG